MTDENFIDQLGISLSRFIPAGVWTQERIWCRGKQGARLALRLTNDRSCGGVLVLGRCLFVHMGGDAARVAYHLRMNNYEVVEVRDNGDLIRL